MFSRMMLSFPSEKVRKDRGHRACAEHVPRPAGHEE